MERLNWSFVAVFFFLPLSSFLSVAFILVFFISKVGQSLNEDYLYCVGGTTCGEIIRSSLS